MIRDVVIVGGGPVGLMLACELRLAGISVTVLEKLNEPTGFSKALGLGGRAIDTLELRGLLERFSEGIPPFNSALAHFGGLPLDLCNLRGKPPRFLPIKQARVEQLLEERALELGAKLRWGHELIALEQDADGVMIDVRDQHGEYQLRARYLVGCDGGHSAVRKLAGIGFPGLAPTILNRVGDITLPEEVAQPTYYALPGGHRIPFGITRTATMSIAMLPIGAGIHRIVVGEPYPPDFDRSAPMTLDELQAGIRQTIGAELPIKEVRWLSRFTDSSRLAERYRAGRVFLAGDAAHVHLPAGGPGLGTGLQDAVNLGWKLAAEIQGWAPDGLLDSYHAERHPVGERVIMHTRAQGVLMGESERTPALRELFGELLQDEQVLRRIVDLLQGNDIRYDMQNDGAAEHPLIGQWAPNLRLSTAEGPRYVAQLMHGARGVLLDLTEGAQLHYVAQGWYDRVDVVAARCSQPAPADGLLIRPDGYVAWAADETDAHLEQGLRRALGTWFGEATEAQPLGHPLLARELAMV